MEEPDSWLIFLDGVEVVCTFILLGISSLYSGAMLEESSQKDITESGVGISLDALAAMLLSALLAVWTAFSFASLTHPLLIDDLSPASAPPIGDLLLVAGLWLLFLILTLMLAILLPLSWGRAHSEIFCNRLRFLAPVCRLFRPLARLVSMPTRVLLRLRGGDIGAVTEEDVLEMVDSVEESSLINESQREMIGNIFELDDVTAADIMTHRTELAAVPITASADDIISTAVEHGYSRIPVYDGSLDNITGIAYVKDLLPYVGRGTKRISLTALLRPTLFVPESRRAHELLFDFQQKKIQLAVVVDEYGGTAGIVTMEDILESIVGDIADEYDEEDDILITENPDGSLLCDGFAEVEDVFDALGAGEPPEDIESETIGGLLTDLLARIPKPGEQPSAFCRNVELTALEADDRRITKVQARLRTSSESK